MFQNIPKVSLKSPARMSSRDLFMSSRVKVLIIIAISLIGMLAALAIQHSMDSISHGGRKFEINLSDARDPEKLNYKVLGEGSFKADGSEIIYVRVEFEGIEWKGKLWKHHATILYSPKCNSRLGAVIAGGYGPKGFKHFAKEFGIKAVAETCVPVLILQDVPNEQFGLKETELMAYTIAKALETGDPSWHLVYPMAFAYSRAMTLESILVPSHPDRFVLSGGSKRGYTTWIVAAHDDRVAAIAPRSFNGANLTALNETHYRVYGKPVGSLAVVHEALSRVNSREGLKGMLRIYDPVSYFDELSVPVMVIFGTDDQLSPPGAEQSYAPYYKGPLWFEIVANATHTGLHSSDRAAAAWRAFLAYVSGKSHLPEVDVSVRKVEKGLEVRSRVSSCAGCRILGVLTWYSNVDRLEDLVWNPWQSVNMKPEEGYWEATIPVKSKYVGIYVEVRFESGGIEGFISSPRIVRGATYTGLKRA